MMPAHFSYRTALHAQHPFASWRNFLNMGNTGGGDARWPPGFPPLRTSGPKFEVFRHHRSLIQAMHTEEQFTSIQQIRDLLFDGRKQYEAIAQRIDGTDLSELLHQVGATREGMARELALDLVQHDPQDRGEGGTVGGALHRMLMTVRDLINNTSDVNLLVECQRQDEALLSRYAQVLDTVDLNEASRATLARQCAEVEAQVQRIVAAREQMEAVER